MLNSYLVFSYYQIPMKEESDWSILGQISTPANQLDWVAMLHGLEMAAYAHPFRRAKF